MLIVKLARRCVARTNQIFGSYLFSKLFRPYSGIFVFFFSIWVVANPVIGRGADFEKGMDAFLKADYASALAEWRPLANIGNAAAQFFLGHMYYDGLGVPQSFRSSREWYVRAADQGYAQAQYFLGIKYRQGTTGTPYDRKIAVKWYEKAALQGHVGGILTMSGFYRVGFGVPVDGEKAVAWLKTSANVAPIQRKLGILYYRGVDKKVRRDYVEAYKWFSLAVKNGDEAIVEWQQEVAKKLSPSQLQEAERRANECINRNFKRC